MPVAVGNVRRGLMPGTAPEDALQKYILYC